MELVHGADGFECVKGSVALLRSIFRIKICSPRKEASVANSKLDTGSSRRLSGKFYFNAHPWSPAIKLLGKALITKWPHKILVGKKIGRIWLLLMTLESLGKEKDELDALHAQTKGQGVSLEENVLKETLVFCRCRPGFLKSRAEV